jgi:hypothetical protein
MFGAPRLIFGGSEGVGSSCYVSRSRTHFRRYHGRFFMFRASEHIFGGTDGVGSRFHVLLSRTRFQWYLGRRVLFSCSALLDSFSEVTSASGAVFIFCAPELTFGGTMGVRSLFHVLRSRTRFRRFRVCRLPFSCSALPDSFSVVPRASGPVFIFYAPELIFGGSEGVGCS